MPKDLKLRRTSDEEAKERPAPQDPRAEWQRPALTRLATSEASMPAGRHSGEGHVDHHS